MTDQNFKRVSDDSRVCAVLTENDPCVRYCVLRGNAFIDENVLSKLYNPYIVFSLFWYHIEYLVYTYRCSVLIYLSTWMLIAEMKASDDYDDNI